MSDDERRSYLSAGTRTGVLSTVRKDGRPHAAPVWFVLDGDTIVFMTGRDTVKGRNLLRTGQATMTVDTAEPPYDFVTVTGTVEASEDLEAMLDRHREAACRPQRPGLDAADRVSVPAGADFRARQPEHIRGRAELEGTKPVIGQYGDPGTRQRSGEGGRLWHDLDATWHHAGFPGQDRALTMEAP